MVNGKLFNFQETNRPKYRSTELTPKSKGDVKSGVPDLVI